MTSQCVSPLPNSKRRAWIVAIAAFACLASSAMAQAPEAHTAGAPAVRVDHDIVVFRDIMVPMRDGARLATDIYLPARNGAVDPAERFPIVLVRTPYNKLEPLPVGVTSYLPKHGYAVVVQDARGTNKSEGVFEPMLNESWGAKQDGADTIAWLIRQPWSNGKVGTTGMSYLGGVQLLIATMNIPGFVTGVIQVPAVNQFGKGWVYDGDMFDLGTNAPWVLGMAPTVAAKSPPAIRDAILADQTAAGGPIGWEDERVWTLLKGRSLRDAPIARHIPFWQEWLNHRDDPTYFANNDAAVRFNQVNKPLLHWTGWYDLFHRNSIDAYESIKSHGATASAREGQRLIIGPWAHVQCGQCRQFPGSQVDDSVATRAWMDWQMGGRRDPVFDHPVIIYVMGADRWRAEDSWPLAGTVRTKYYLHSNGRANSSGSDGSISTYKPMAAEPADSYISDPSSPVPSLGGHVLYGGPRDQQMNERRTDVLIYSTPPLSEDVEVTGHVRATLYASSSATDTDWHIKLIDVFPDGRAYNVVNSAVRARYRKSRTAPTALTPGSIEAYDVDLWSTSNVFRKDHRIRVEIASSDYPSSDLNPNQFMDLSEATAKDYVVAQQKIFHDATHPSSIELPIIPAERARKWIPTPFPKGAAGRFYPNLAPLPEPQPTELPTTELRRQ